MSRLGVATQASFLCGPGSAMIVGPMLPRASRRWSASSLLVPGVLLLAQLAACSTDTSRGEAHRLVAQGAMLLDVRSRSEYAERHIEGAVNIPVEELRRRMAELGSPERAPEVVVYCHSGARAGIAARWLRARGYRVHNLGSMGHYYAEPATPTTF